VIGCSVSVGPPTDAVVRCGPRTPAVRLGWYLLRAGLPMRAGMTRGRRTWGRRATLAGLAVLLTAAPVTLTATTAAAAPEAADGDGSGGAIHAKYLEMGGAYGIVAGHDGYEEWLGEAVGPLTCGLPRQGCTQSYSAGSIVWAPDTGAQWLSDALLAEWEVEGGPAGFLGYPLGDVGESLHGPEYTVFEGGVVHCSPTHGAHVLRGVIGEKWALQDQAPDPLGRPVSEEIAVHAGVAQLFEKGSIYYETGRGTHVIRGAIRDRWAALGFEQGPLGYPVVEEVPVHGGRAQLFWGGSIYSSPASGAHAVWGAIRSEWAALGFEQGTLGFPVSDEITLRSGGAASVFQGGSVYFSPATGAHAVWGAIRDRWAALGFERGSLGFPVTDEIALRSGGAASVFQGGSVYFSPATGAHAVQGAIRDRWAASGWEGGRLGYPTSDEYDVPGGRRSDFQFGSITWTPARGAVSSR
jgi:uncharacterized protein with LGFP repeats